MEEFVKISSDKERAKSLLDMVAMRMDTIKLLYKTNPEKFTSKIIEEYYESILELITAIMSIDGFKIRADVIGSHMSTIDYLHKNYREVEEHEIRFIDDLRKKRIGIKYYGRRVKIDYVKDNQIRIKNIIKKLRSIINKKIL